MQGDITWMAANEMHFRDMILQRHVLVHVLVHDCMTHSDNRTGNDYVMMRPDQCAPCMI